MAGITKMMTFEQFQEELRRKRLQKVSSPAVLDDGNRKAGRLWSPSISSIPFDSSYATSPLETGSSVNKEIISASNNVRNMYLKMQHLKGDQKKIVTSSVKGMSTESDDQMDRLTMPPPKFYPHPSHSGRKYCGRSSSDNLSKQNERIPSDIEYESSERNHNYKHPSHGERHPSAFTPPRVVTDSFERNRRTRTFKKWTVALNEQRELIIKGTLESGRLARSKPISRRLTCTTLESVSEHLYRLQGNLVDNDHGLPEYIRGKFYSGFPDDWENVYEIWRTYVEKGCSVTFRWPTPITDSDDDINSEVTDITIANLKTSEKEDSDSSGESNAAPFISKYSYKVLRRKDKYDIGSCNRQKSDSFTQTPTSIFDVTRHSTHTEQRDMRFPLNNFVHDDKENIDADTSRVSAAANKLVNSVNVIVNTLTENNQSVECINKLATMLDFISCFVLNGSVKEGDTSKENSKLTGEPNGLNLTYNFAEPVHSESILPLRNTINKEVASCDNSSQRKRTFSRAIGDDNDSDNEVYSGVTKIRLNQVIRQKETVLKPSKRKVRKQEVSGTPNKPTVTSNHVAEYPAGKVVKDDEKRLHNESDDSSISIMYEERDRLKVKNCMNSNTQSIAERRQPRMKSSKEFTKDRNVRETKEDSVPKSSRVEHPIYGASVKRAKNEIMEPNSNESNGNRLERIEIENNDRQDDSFLEKSGKSLNSPRLQDILKKMTSKPVVISSVPLEIKIDSANRNYSPRNEKENLFEDAEKKTSVVKASKNGLKNLKKEESPLKSDNRNKSKDSLSVNVNSLSDNDDDDNRHIEYVEVHQTNDNDFIVSDKSLQKNDITASNAKLLSAWAPRVITCGTDLCLIFEGKLINEAGHVINKKFKTDTILRRVSARMVETVHHEFYQLIGSMSAKHVVPKKLLNHCRHGCPSRIERFCETWKSLQDGTGDSVTKARSKLDSSKNVANVSISSKGRKIISPVNYWAAGQRILNGGEDATGVRRDLKNDFQDSIGTDQARKQKRDNSNETQSATDKSGKNSSKQGREGKKSRRRASNGDTSSESSTADVENSKASRGNFDDKKARRAEGNAQTANARIANLAKQTVANHSSTSVKNHIQYSYHRVPMVSMEDDISYDEHFSQA